MSEPVTHRIKTWPEYFQTLKDGTKTFEVRFNDRGYRVGDYLHHQEYDPNKAFYTGEELVQKVTYIVRGNAFGIEADHCVMSVVTVVSP